MSAFHHNFEEASVISPGTLLYKLSFAIQFSEEYKSTVLHWHDHTQIWYVSDGELIHLINNNIYIQKAGSVIFVPPYISHSIDSTKSKVAPRYGQISFTDRFLTDRSYNFFSYYPKHAHFEGRTIPEYVEFLGSNKNAVDDIINEMYYEFSKEKGRSFNKITSMLSQLLGYMTSDCAHLNPRGFKHLSERANAVAKSIRYMAEHYADKISLDALCSISHMSRSFLTENFRKITGRTAFEILTSIRLRNALHSLLFSDLTLTEIAKNVGLETKSRFSHEFSKRYGIPPMEYRRRFQVEYLERDEILAAYWEQFDHLDV